MTHRQVREALSGLLLAMFVAMLSSTIVSNALPTIVDDSAIGALIAVLFIKAVPLRTSVLREDELAPEAQVPR